MGYHVQINSKFTRELANYGGWTEFKKFFEKVVARVGTDRYVQTAHFIEHGWNERPLVCLEELRNLLAQKPNEYVMATIKDWISTIESGPKKPHIMTITDGTEDDDNFQDEGQDEGVVDIDQENNWWIAKQKGATQEQLDRLEKRLQKERANRKKKRLKQQSPASGKTRASETSTTKAKGIPKKSPVSSRNSTKKSLDAKTAVAKKQPAKKSVKRKR